MSILGATATTLYTRLSGGTALTSLLAGSASVYHQFAPTGAAYPYVVYNLQAGGPDNMTRANIETNVWLVRGYSKTSAKNAADIAAAIDARLHKINIPIGSATTFWCTRDETVSAFEQGADNQNIWTAGGMYRVRTSGG